MAVPRAPKQWQLTTEETINSFENWRQNLEYILSLDKNFEMFLAADCVWQKKSAANPNRGFLDDQDDVPVANRRTAIQKRTHLEMMLGQIANYCPVINRNSIIKSSVSLNDIWQKIRQHYGFQSTGGHFLDLADIKQKPGEKPQDLYQRIVAFFEDNLLTRGGGITHYGQAPGEDEELSPSLENTIVFLWLQLVHPGLPNLVKQKFGSELRHQTLATLKPEISQSLQSLLDELRSIEDTKVMRLSAAPQRRRPPSAQSPHSQGSQFRSCVLCKTAGRPHNSHYLSGCKFLPEADRRAMSRVRLVGEEDENTYEDEDTTSDDLPEALLDTPIARRVNVVQSPYFKAFYNHHPVRLTLDTGATTNMIKASVAHSIQLPIVAATQMAHQADGVTPLEVIGEVHCELTRGVHTFQLDALVVNKLDVDILAGNPFHYTNDIASRPAKSQIVIGGSDVITYGTQKLSVGSVRRTQASVLRGPLHKTVLLPGEYLQLDTPEDMATDMDWVLEPRLDVPLNAHCKPEKAWPHPQEISAVGRAVRVLNDTPEPLLIHKNEHLCQIRAICNEVPATSRVPEHTPPTISSDKCTPHSSQIVIDPDDQLLPSVVSKFKALHLQYDQVFSPDVPKYNGASGDIQAVVNMGPTLPPQRKGRLPQYNRSNMIELQAKFDELENMGVFAKPEDVGVTVEYLNLSFLVKKPNGGCRLVTSFGEVAAYSKPQPSLMPNVDSVLRDIGTWKYVIVSDLLKSFYQIPLARASMKYCGVVTPFKGIRVYTRCAMGMPGSETVLEELMCRVLGDLIQEGCVAKIADDLYCGGDDPEDALRNWARVLAAMKKKQPWS